MRVGPLEREILEVLWEQGPQPVGEILDTLNEGARRDRAYNTVMSTAARMEGKGLLSRRRDGRAFVYEARSANPEDLAVDQIVAELEQAAGMASDDVVAHAVLRWAGRDAARMSALEKIAAVTPASTEPTPRAMAPEGA